MPEHKAPQKSREQQRPWVVKIIPVGTVEDGSQAQKRALEVVAKRYRIKQLAQPSEPPEG